jgi:hypothetical protein
MKQIYDNKDIGETIDKSFDAGIKEGYRRCREEMMKEVVECETVCIKNRLFAVLPMKEFQWTVGDKVRIIVIPNTDEK